LCQRRFPGEAPLVEAVSAFLDHVAKDAGTDPLAMDDRQNVHCGHSNVEGARPRESPPETG